MIKFHSLRQDRSEAFEYCFRNNAQAIVDLFDKVNTSNEACARVFCQLSEGWWDDEVLGEFRGEMFASVLQQYIDLNSNSYLNHKYCSCHNPYVDTKFNHTEDEWQEQVIAILWGNHWRRLLSNTEKLFDEYESKVKHRPVND